MDGADFVDLYGDVDSNGRQDNITVNVLKEYMSDEAHGLIEDSMPEPPPGVNLEEDIMEPDITTEDIENIMKDGIF